MKKKMVSFFMAMLMVLSSMMGVITPVQAAVTPVLGTVHLSKLADATDVIKHHGSFLGQTMATVGYTKDGKTMPAYCMEPTKNGATTSTGYDVNADTLLDNPKVYTAIVNGYPFVDNATLGVQNNEEAYIITKLAVWSCIDPYYSDVEVYKAVDGKEYVLTAFKKLATLAQNATAMPSMEQTLTMNRIDVQTTTTSLVQTFNVSSNGSPFTGNYTATLPTIVPDGTTITDKTGDTFKVVIPLASIPDNTTGSFDVALSAGSGGGNALVYVGVPNDANTQMYAVTVDGESSGSGKVEYGKEVKTDTGSGGLRILKRHAGTLTPLQGATFRLIKLDDPNAGLIGDFETDAKGEKTFPTLAIGAYSVTEIKAPKGYLLDIVNMKNVTITAGAQTAQDVVFDNFKTPTLKLFKTGTKGEVIVGAVFEIALDGGNEKYTGTTDAKGEIIFGKDVDLQEGTYTVTEVAVPAPYILDKTPKSVKLVADKETHVSFTNAKKVKWRIWKYIKGTETLLSGAEFSVTNLDTNTIVWQGIVEDGFHELDGLDAGWYRISEIATAHGYVMEWVDEFGTIHKDAPYKDIKLEADKEIDIKFDNVRRPEIEIVKVDNFGKPLAGAIFKFKKGDSTTQFEKTTDENGKIIVAYDDKDLILTEGVYEVTETKAPDGYLMSKECVQTVTLENGTRKVLTFVNTKRPVLELKKIDAITKLPLAGAKFKVTKTEDKTVSEYITDATGIVTIPNLDEAVYTVEEILAPDGFILDTQHKEIALERGKTKTLIYENTKKPTLIITKINAMTLKPIPHTTYKIEYEASNGGLVNLGTFVTNENGQIVLPKVNVGWYVISETIPAQGMSKPSNPVRRVYLSAGENAYLPTTTTGVENVVTVPTTPSTPVSTITPQGVTVTSGEDYTNAQGEVIENYPLNSIVIKKIDAVTSEMLEGAVFEVRKIDGQQSGTSGTIIGRYNTKPSGIVVITGLEAGQYIVEEVSPPTNYLISENSKQTTSLKADGTSVVEVTFQNFPYGHILVTKVDALTGKPLANAKFQVTDGTHAVAGNTNDEFTTDENGEFKVPNLKPNSYVVTEIQAPTGYEIDTTPQVVNVGTDGKVYKVNFKNQPFGKLVLKKYNAVTKEPLADAEFKVTTAKGDVVGNSNGIFKTDPKGTVEIPNLTKGSYVVQEIKAPLGFILEQQTQTVEIEYGKTHVLDFYNKPMSSIQIIKIDAESKLPLKDAKFNVYKKNGELIGEFITDGNGLIMIPDLAAGWYKITETKAPNGYKIDETAKDVELTSNQFLKVVFENRRLTSLIIKKVDDKDGSPLIGAKFTVERQNGEHVGEYTTDKDGTINIPTLSPDWYVVREKFAPVGYFLDDSPKTVQVKTDTPTIVTFTNKKLTALEIIKLDEKSNEPLNGAVFVVEKQNGERIGEYTTSDKGIISIPTLQPDFYVVKEIKPPTGYVLSNIPQVVEVKTNTPTVVKFTNKKMTSLQIKKVDAQSGVALAGAVFVVEKQNGEKVQTAENGTEWTTDAQGFINIPTLSPDFYVIREVKAPTNYILDQTPKTVEVKTNAPTVVTFANKALAGLKIIKTNSENRNPIEGTEFVISKMSGEKVENDFKGFIFKTDKTGQIFIPNLTDGYYTVTETKAVDGFILDGEPKTILIESGKNTLLEVENTPASGLLIVKTDAQTKKPLQGVKFSVKKANGERVQSSLLDKNQPTTENNSPNKSTTPNGDISGVYTTDPNGRILINYLAVGEYNVTEVEPLKGYELDTNVHSVTVTAGKQAILQLTNKPLSGLRILKVDSVTGNPIFDVEFMVFDSNLKQVGTFYTDNQGIIDFSAILTEGRYTLRETRPAEGYYQDNLPRTVEFIAGKVTDIVWKNVPQAGQIQVTKLSANDNEVNGLQAGTPLADAIFEVYSYKSGNVVDRFITGDNGRGVSNVLPLGRYTVREVQAPPFYKLSTKELDITIEFATQIVKLEFTNESANTGVSIDKVAPKEVVQGQELTYTIKKVRNDSTVPLTDFYWRDNLPTDAVRLEKIVTGTYNQSLKYKVMVTTNRGNTMVIADNMMTTKNNVIGCTNAELGLPNDEYVTSFTLYFGNVKAGFTSVDEPKVYTKVRNANLPNGYIFANKADVGGKYSGSWVISNSTTNTTIYNPRANKLPKTGN